jgi:hypothetical protein
MRAGVGAPSPYFIREADVHAVHSVIGVERMHARTNL